MSRERLSKGERAAMISGTRLHPTVMPRETLEYLRPEKGGHTYTDATLGTGGLAAALCEALEGDAVLLGIERDPEMAEIAGRRLEALRQTWPTWRYHIVVGSYRDLPAYLAQLGLNPPRGIVGDFGASYLQLTGSRGISFQDESAPLDGRYNPEEGGLTIADVVNTWEAKEIAGVLRQFGDERKAATIARRIVQRRAVKPFEAVGDLATTIRSCFPPRYAPGGIDDVTRSWQALRICVNLEMEHLEAGVRAMIESLAPGGGRLVTITFHSGEARIVKKLFSEYAGPVTDHANPYTLHPDAPREYRLVTRKGVQPDEDEKRRIPGARSARLRCLERV